MNQKRCDICRLKEQLEPRTLFDVLAWTSPPLSLLEAIERWVAAAPGKVDPDIIEYRRKWGKLMAGEPVAQVDKFEQQALVKAEVKYG